MNKGSSLFRKLDGEEIISLPLAASPKRLDPRQGAAGPLAGQLVCLPTVTSVFTMFCFTFVFQSMGLL